MDEITLKLSKHAVFCLKIVTFAAERLLNRRFNIEFEHSARHFSKENTEFEHSATWFLKKFNE